MKANILKLFIYLFILLSLFVLYGCTKHKITDKKINIIFRYDDPSVLTANDIESKVLNIFKEHNLSLTFAVIPYRCAGDPIDPSPQNVLPLNDKKANLFKKFIQNGTLDIALHGYSHQTRSDKFWTEFMGVPYNEQLQKLEKGKKLFETFFSQSIISFVPPYNTYDENTIKALEALHFSTISANLEGIQPKKSKLNFISHTITINKIDEAIEDVKDNDEKESYIVVMFHGYNFSNVKMEGVDKPEITFLELDQLLTRLKKEKNIHIISLSQASKQLKSL